MKGVSCVYQLSSVKYVTIFHTVAQNLAVGPRLNQFWKTLVALGASSKVIRILKEGYTLLSQNRPLTRSPVIINGNVNPLGNSYLMEALHALTQKNGIEKVKNQTSLDFFNRIFLVPKPNNKLRPMLDLSSLSKYL